MKVPRTVRPLLLALIAAGVIGSSPANAVRVNADGHGQALIYPYYTARSTTGGNVFVTAVSVTNVTPKPKAVKVRFLEGRAGATVLDFNLYLAAYDVWTAGILPAGSGAGIFTKDNSCTTPALSRSSSTPTNFRNSAYIGDALDDSLDRTYEGFFEVLEMGVIDPLSPLGVSVTHVPNLSSSNASKPRCTDLPATDDVPAGLSRPTGGLVGNASYINVNEGTDYNVDAIALSGWSDKMQWSAVGNAHPNVADASPAISHIVYSQDDGDRLIITRWDTGRDAVSAVLMVDRVVNDYTVEPNIKAATDWVLAMPTKRFYFTDAGVERPFNGVTGALGRYGEWLSPSTFPEVYGPPGLFYDREGQDGGGSIACLLPCATVQPVFPGSAGVWSWLSADAAVPVQSSVMASKTLTVQRLGPNWINGWGQLEIPTQGLPTPLHRLVAPAGATTAIDAKTGAVGSNLTATYWGLPIVGFSVQSYTNGTLIVGGASVLSNYGGSFPHKFTRRIELTQ